MNTKTLLTVKMDKKIKEAGQEVARNLGFSLGTLVNAYVKDLIRKKEVHFEEAYVPSDYLKRIIAESKKEFDSGKLPIYKNMKEAIKSLRS